MGLIARECGLFLGVWLKYSRTCLASVRLQVRTPVLGKKKKIKNMGYHFGLIGMFWNEIVVIVVQLCV
jgi:hypothetical protein